MSWLEKMNEKIEKMDENVQLVHGYECLETLECTALWTSGLFSLGKRQCNQMHMDHIHLVFYVTHFVQIKYYQHAL